MIKKALLKHIFPTFQIKIKTIIFNLILIDNKCSGYSGRISWASVIYLSLQYMVTCLLPTMWIPVPVARPTAKCNKLAPTETLNNPEGNVSSDAQSEVCKEFQVLSTKIHTVS